MWRRTHRFLAWAVGAALPGFLAQTALSAPDVRFEAGYAYGPQAGQVPTKGSTLSIVGLVSSFENCLSDAQIDSNAEHTFVLSGCTAETTFVTGSSSHQYRTIYSGGILRVFEDPAQNAFLASDPPNSFVPGSFEDGTPLFAFDAGSVSLYQLVSATGQFVGGYISGGTYLAGGSQSICLLESAVSNFAVSGGVSSDSSYAIGPVTGTLDGNCNPSGSRCSTLYPPGGEPEAFRVGVWPSCAPQGTAFYPWFYPCLGQFSPGSAIDVIVRQPDGTTTPSVQHANVCGGVSLAVPALQIGSYEVEFTDPVSGLTASASFGTLPPGASSRPPEPATNVRATNRGDGQSLLVEWGPSPTLDNAFYVIDRDYFWIDQYWQRRIISSGTVAVVDSSARSWIDTGLSPGGNYCYRVRGSYSPSGDCAGGVNSEACAVPSVVLTILSPSSNDFWLTGEPTIVAITWSADSSLVDSVAMLYSSDGGGSWLHLNDGNRVAFSAGQWTGAIDLPAQDTLGAVVRLDAYSASEGFLGSSIGAGFAVGNHRSIRLDVQRLDQSAFSPPVIFWEPVPEAVRYEVRVSSDPLTSCRQASWPSDGTYRVDAPRTYARFDPSAWEDFPATRCNVSVEAFGTGGQSLGPAPGGLQSFVRFKLSDLDPYDTENKPPVVLVHGWISSQSTWFVCGVSPLKDGLINGPPGQRFHPWGFEYPNIEPIVHSAAGLDTAARYVFNRAGGGVRFVAHSMGGLVTRSYIQGLAVDPSLNPDGSYPLRLPSIPISHVVTLSTPHLGEPPEAVLTAAHRHSTGEILGVPGRYLAVTCPGCEQSASALNLRSDSPLLLRLNSSALPPLAYFFAGGIDHVGEAAGAYRGHRLEELSGCDLGADATVDVCSARAQCGESTDGRRRPTFESGATIVRAHYNLSHGRMSRPGAVYDPPKDCEAPTGQWKEYNALHQSESTYLLNDVLGFLRCGSCLLTSACPNPDRKQFRQRLVTRRPGNEAAKPSVEERTGISSAEASVAGAAVRLFHLDSSDSLAGLIAFSDAEGEVNFSLPAGKYGLEFRAQGMATRIDTVEVPAATTQVMRTTALEVDSGYTGPHDPVLLINNGALATNDSVVVVSAVCVGATQVLLSERPDFAGAIWQALAGPVDLTLSSEPGMKAVYATFRDELLREGGPLSALIRLSSAPQGSVSVNLIGTTGEVVIDGVSTGRLTPAASIPLAEGIHLVSIRAPGWVIQPQVASVAVTSGGAAQANFSADAAPTPADAIWMFPVDGETIGSESQLRWRSASPPTMGEVVFYDCSISRDSTFNNADVLRLGLPDTTLWLPPTLNDSTIYFASLRAVNGFGVPQVGPAAVTRFQIQQPVTAVGYSPRSGTPWLQVSPNPALGPARVTLFLPSASLLNLNCYDVGGRKVATLAHGRFDAGLHVILWPPTSAGGDLSAGIYFMKLRLPGRTVVTRLLILR
jgi:hypothetical protein